MPGKCMLLQVDQRVLGHLIEEHFPQLHQHLKDGLGVDPALPLPGWLLSGFVTSGMPFETVARLWDVAFLERSAAPLVRWEVLKEHVGRCQVSPVIGKHWCNRPAWDDTKVQTWCTWVLYSWV